MKEILEILKYSIPAIMALIGTGITLLYQYKIKKVELDKQNEFKARKVLFNFKQERIKDTKKTINDINDSLDSLTKYMASSANAENKLEFVLNGLKMFEKLLAIDNLIEGMENHLKGYNVYDKDLENKVNYVKEFFSSEYIKKDLEELESSSYKIIHNTSCFMEYFLNIYEKEATDMFEKYIK